MDIRQINNEQIVNVIKQYATLFNITIAASLLVLLITIVQMKAVYNVWQASATYQSSAELDLDVPLFSYNIGNDVIDLFGRYRPEEDLVAQETTLPLLLKGLFYSHDSGSSTAFISYSNQPELAYGEGAMLPENVELYAIERDHVILYHRDRLERLGFADEAAFTEQLIQPEHGELSYADPAYSRVINEDLAEHLGWNDDYYDILKDSFSEYEQSNDLW